MIRVMAAAALAVAWAPAAQATSLGSLPPHRPELACGRIDEVVANLNQGRLRDVDASWGPSFYSDAFGRIDLSEEDAFLASLRTSNGRPDGEPIAVERIQVLDAEDGIYLVTLRRVAWQLVRYEQNDMLLYDAIPDPHYEERRSSWIVSFTSWNVRDFREANELSTLWDRFEELTGCLPSPEQVRRALSQLPDPTSTPQEPPRP